MEIKIKDMRIVDRVFQIALALNLIDYDSWCHGDYTRYTAEHANHYATRFLIREKTRWR